MIRIFLFYILPVSTVSALYLVWVYRNKIKSPPKMVIIIFCIVLISIASAGYLLRNNDFLSTPSIVSADK